MVYSTQTLSSFDLLSFFLFSPKKFRDPEGGPEGGPEGAPEGGSRKGSRRGGPGFVYTQMCATKIQNPNKIRTDGKNIYAMQMNI